MHQRTEVPILLNTSFNVQSEPIVETPEDALWTILFSAIDACLFEGKLVRKSSTARSPLELTVIPKAEVSRLDENHLVVVTQRPYLGKWEWVMPANAMDSHVVRAVIEGAAARPTGTLLLKGLRDRFGARFGTFLPLRDEHALALMRRSGLIDLAG
jgi:hypothetical protein